jgi:intein/homing endonuclease
MKYSEYILELKSSNKVHILEDNSEYIICKSRKGPSKPIHLPKKLTNNLAYFIGVIYGDGWINSEVNRIGLDKGNFIFLKEVYSPLLFDLFNLKLRITKAHRSWRVCFKNKILWDLLIHVFEISANKSRTSRVPEIIKHSNLEIQKAFLAGLLDTDGGSRGNSFGFTTASKILNEEVIILMKLLDIPVSIDSWFNKKYNSYYYGWRLKKSDCKLLREQIPLKNKKRLVLLSNLCRGAGVVK